MDRNENILLEVKRLFLGGVPVLKGLNLKVREGEIHAVLGANGTGKSTLAYTVMGLSGYKPERGKIIFDGKDITNLSVTERAKLGITLAWQDPAQFEGITVEEYLSLGKKDGGLPPQEALNMVGLVPSRYMRRIVNHTLSGGERKRIELASVLVMSPRLVILDEPDSGIDVISIDDIMRVVKFMKVRGSTVLLITHRENFAQIADRASHICGGMILKEGNPNEVIEFYKAYCTTCDHINLPIAREKVEEEG